MKDFVFKGLMIFTLSALAIGLTSTMFIFWKGWILSVFAFLLIIVSSIVGPKNDTNHSHSSSDLFGVLFIVLGTICVVSLIIMFSSAELGVCKTDYQHIFARRDHYIMNNHGKYTEVSRSRYLLAGSSFMVGWHCLVAIFALTILSRHRKRQDNSL